MSTVWIANSCAGLRAGHELENAGGEEHEAEADLQALDAVVGQHHGDEPFEASGLVVAFPANAPGGRDGRGYVRRRTARCERGRMRPAALSAMLLRTMSATPATKLTRAQVGDLVLAAALVIVGVVGTAGASAGTTPDRPIDLAGYLVVVGAGAVLVVRRRWPVVTLVVVAALTAGYLAVGYAFGPILFSFFAAVYTAARHRPLGRAGPWALVALAFLSVHAFTNSAALPGVSGALLASGWVVVPFAIGATRRVTREAVERERAEMIRQRVDLERLRVAHEVHDIVGHGLAAIRMQAEVALHVLPKRPEQAKDALEAISRTSGDALDELRTTLGGIRDHPAQVERAEPRLERLDDLQQRMTDAGVRVQIEIAGDPQPLPPAVDLAGYRVVQESLTNVLRHSRAGAADVHIDYQADTVVITVSNPTPDAVPPTADGLGIAGMRRRVTLLGGELTAGPTPEHRFEVRARIPTNGRP